MKKFLILLALTATLPAHAAGPWLRMFQDMKLPTQALLEDYKWTAPAAQNAAAVASVLGASFTATSSFSGASLSGSIDVPRNVVLTVGGTAGNVLSGTAVVTGKNIFGQAISENFTVPALTTGAITGSKAFKSVSLVTFPQASASGVTVSVGVGKKLGLLRCMDDAGKYQSSEFAGVFDSTRGTVAADATHVESNTFAPNSTLDGSSSVEILFVQNFRCF